MEQNGAKRRLVSRESSYDCLKSNGNNRLLVDSATNTECQIPMQLNAWTQTSTEDFNPNLNTTIIDALQNRIDKLEEMFRSLNSNEKIMPPAIVNTEPQEIVIPAELYRDKHPPKQTKYKIITSRGVEYIEPIEVVYEDENTYHDLNTSVDSQRLEICLPKDDEEQQQQQQIQQEGEQNNVQQNQIVYQTKIEQQEQHIDHKYYNIPTLHNTQLPTALQQQTLNSSQQSLNSSNEVQSPIIESKHIMKKERKTRKSYLNNGSTITTETQEEVEQRLTVHDVTNVVVSIGPNNTRIPAHIYDTIDWSSPTGATRKLLITIFNRETLATHTMTGKPSPAFRGRNMPIKHQLDPEIVSDIIFIVSRKCGVPEKDVRNAITTKCADENKMSKQREKKRNTLSEYNKENVIKNITKTETY